MSYSRWINSFWYTYWSCPLPEHENVRDEQVFCICGIMDFTYRELKDNIGECLYRLEKYIRENGLKQDREYLFVPSEVSDEQLEELEGYMQQFIRDVEEDDTLE